MNRFTRDVETHTTLDPLAGSPGKDKTPGLTRAQANAKMRKLTIVKKILEGVENHRPLFITSQKMAGNPSIPVSNTQS
jgi:hypothetical protein